MTQKHRRILAYVLACSVLTGSLTAWTVVVLRYGARESSQSILQGALVSEAIAPLPNVLNQANEPIAPHEPREPPSPPEHPAAAGVTPESPPSELLAWGLSRSFSLSIPSLGIRAPVLSPSRNFWDGRLWDLLEEQMQVGLRFGLVEYPHSTAPGSEGALIIAGHSSPPDAAAAASAYGTVFARLPEIQPKDTITVHASGGSFLYRVKSTRIVSPAETAILAQESGIHLLKLITCYPVGTTRDRLLVVAEYVPTS